nr:GM04578p [Drosophila melanogaster]
MNKKNIYYAYSPHVVVVSTIFALTTPPGIVVPAPVVVVGCLLFIVVVGRPPFAIVVAVGPLLVVVVIVGLLPIVASSLLVIVSLLPIGPLFNNWSCSRCIIIRIGSRISIIIGTIVHIGTTARSII